MMKSLALLAAAVLVGLGPDVAVADSNLVIQNPLGDDNPILLNAMKIPVCANVCYFQSAVAMGCERDDYHCQCAKNVRPQLEAVAQNCLAHSCDKRQIKAAAKTFARICKDVANGVANPSRPDPAAVAAAVAAANPPSPAFPPPAFPDAPFPDATFPDAPFPDAFPPPPPAFEPPIHFPADKLPPAGLFKRAAAADTTTAVGSFASSATASSIPSSIMPATAATATATTTPSSVSTSAAGSLRLPAPAAALAGAGAIVAAALML